ncbi:MAG TPA: helix-turn-helix domain-containing protein [Solirubrobacterales bacterium]|nr:helix-turn-helix domain-containing protein [Solirubrobacterales bacterium]
MRSSSAIGPPHASRAEIAEIIETLSAELDDISAALTDTIHEHLEELDDDMRTWTLQSTRANLGVMVTLMREGADPRTTIAPPEAIGYAKEYVLRGLDFGLLQRAYRSAQGVFSGMILERLRETTDDADHLADAMVFFNAWIFAWIEALERQLTEVYMSEREQWVRGAAAMRAAEVRALLGGARVDVADVSQRLGYELDRFHVGYVVWNETAEDSPGDGQALFGEMEQVAAAVAESLGARSALTVAQGRHLACWAGRHEPQHLGDLRVPRGAGRTISVAAGTPAHGVEGFVLSHREALLARRVAQLRGDSRAARVTFPDLALEALMVNDVNAARRFAERELGPLAAADDATVRLASTLAVFLDEGASFVRAARRLGVHTNTVTYRVHRAEELLGHPVGERQLELRAALRLARLVPGEG